MFFQKIFSRLAVCFVGFGSIFFYQTSFGQTTSCLGGYTSVTASGYYTATSTGSLRVMNNVLSRTVPIILINAPSVVGYNSTGAWGALSNVNIIMYNGLIFTASLWNSMIENDSVTNIDRITVLNNPNSSVPVNPSSSPANPDNIYFEVVRVDGKVQYYTYNFHAYFNVFAKYGQAGGSSWIIYNAPNPNNPPPTSLGNSVVFHPGKGVCSLSGNSLTYYNISTAS